MVTDIACLLLLTTQNGWTPLMAASFSGHVEVVTVLIKAGAKIHLQDKVCHV